jgi:hypothetical protein
VVINLDYVLVFHLSQKVDNTYCFGPLLLEKGRNINACNHLNEFGLSVKISKNLSIPSFEIKDFLNILIA